PSWHRHRAGVPAAGEGRSARGAPGPRRPDRAGRGPGARRPHRRAGRPPPAVRRAARRGRRPGRLRVLRQDQVGLPLTVHPADLPGPLVFVDDLGAPALTEEDEHHLRRVLRVRAGEPVIAGDGRGRWRAAVLPADGPLLTDLGDIRQTEAPQPEISIGFALVKGEKADLIVQKLTELGVDRICPFRADRSVVRWDSARAAKATARWRTVARNAAMQCHRPWLPVV